MNVVLFTPADVTPPRDAAARLTRVADYTEAFLVKWMKHWGYPPAREKIFERNADRSLRVLFVQGMEKRASGKYDQPGFEAEIWNQAIPKYQLGRHQHVWWISVYLGDPPLRFRGFEGRGNVKSGGNALTNYLNARGEIRLSDDLAAPFPEAFSLKGAMHELGHAFGLPHNGPLRAQNLGMPLMGPTIDSYRTRTKTTETRGYLSAASAAMLWKHPVFAGTAKDRELMPSVQVADLRLNRPTGARSWRLSGVLESNYSAHSVVVLDSVETLQETYWQKSYVARIQKDGRFECEISEPTGVDGTFKLLFCFDNGAVTGDGKDYGIQGVLERQYRASGQLVP